MIRDNYDLTKSMTLIRDALKSGNEKALHDVPQQILDLLDTLHQRPDSLNSQRHDARIHELEMDNRYLNDQVNNLTALHNQTQGTLKKMGEELDKFRKIFNFMMEQKEVKDNEDV